MSEDLITSTISFKKKKQYIVFRNLLKDNNLIVVFRPVLMV